MKRNALILLALLMAVAPVASIADVRERASTVADQQQVNLTVYNNGTALIHDQRRIRLDAGVNRIAWRDVSANMEPTSAILDPLAPTAHVSVLEQDFDYDVLSQDSLLRKFVGKEVIVVHPARFTGERDRREPARVLSVDNGTVLQYRDRIETWVDGYIEFPGIPKGLRDRPTLTLDVESDRTGPQMLDLGYLSAGLTWSADYVGTLSPDQSHMDLIGLVTLGNTSGTSFTNARLQLIAGNVNTGPPPQGTVLKTISRITSNVYNANAQQENLFEYHLYTLAHRTTILDKQTKQLTLLSAREIPITKALELRGDDYYYRNADADLGQRLAPRVYVSFVNRGGDLGIPLPAGQLRIYQNDSRGLSQFAGADSIPHTPRNDTVRLLVGESFDIVAHKRQTDFRLLTDCSTSSSYEIDFTSGKDIDQNVTVVEPIPGDWTITQTSQPFKKSSGSTATWLVHVPKEGQASLTYTANVTWCRNP